MSPAPAACVFCGEPIKAADEVSGRPPHAAHARCADAALADDRHWDAVAAATGDVDQPHVPEAQAAETGRRAGCLGSIGVALLTAGAFAAAAARLAGERRR